MLCFPGHLLFFNRLTRICTNIPDTNAMFGSNPLDDQGDTLADTDTHGAQGVAAAIAL